MFAVLSRRVEFSYEEEDGEEEEEEEEEVTGYRT